MIKGIDPRNFDQQARQIKDHALGIMARWGLIPRFKRWRLTQDRETGMVVLFGVLNDKYIALHTTTPFSDYFDPRLLHDFADELKVQVVSCNNVDDLRYAFILDRGSFGRLPTHIDYPFIDKGKLLVRVVFNPAPEPTPILPVEIDDNRFMRQIAEAFLKVFEDIKLRDDATLLLSAQNPPEISVINEVEFKRRVMEHEINRQKVKRVQEYFNERGKG